MHCCLTCKHSKFYVNLTCLSFVNSAFPYRLQFTHTVFIQCVILACEGCSHKQRKLSLLAFISAFQHLSMGCNATWQGSYISTFCNDLQRSNVGQTSLVFGLWSEFISRSVHTGLQVSMCSGDDLCHSDYRQTYSFRQVILLAQPAELKRLYSYCW